MKSVTSVKHARLYSFFLVRIIWPNNGKKGTGLLSVHQVSVVRTELAGIPLFFSRIFSCLTRNKPCILWTIWQLAMKLKNSLVIWALGLIVTFGTVFVICVLAPHQASGSRITRPAWIFYQLGKSRGFSFSLFVVYYFLGDISWSCDSLFAQTFIKFSRAFHSSRNSSGQTKLLLNYFFSVTKWKPRRYVA